MMEVWVYLIGGQVIAMHLSEDDYLDLIDQVGSRGAVQVDCDDQVHSTILAEHISAIVGA